MASRTSPFGAPHLLSSCRRGPRLSRSRPAPVRRTRGARRARQVPKQSRRSSASGWAACGQTAGARVRAPPTTRLVSGGRSGT